MSLTDLVQIIAPDRDDDPEDIFASAPGLIFTDDLRNSHGSPDDLIVYKSQRFGDIELRTADPKGEDERKLFSHYLWNAGIKLAELVSQQDGGAWDVENEKILELGAGVALDGIVATLAGAKEVVITDYPAPVVLENICRNMRGNVPSSRQSGVCVEGHEWGMLDSTFATKNKNRFSRILAADCYWMEYQHENLVRSMLHFLSLEPTARIFAIAGFHTGRAKLAAFFGTAAEHGLEPDEIYEEDDVGNRREWLKERDSGREDHTERKKWLVICRLKRKESPA